MKEKNKSLEHNNLSKILKTLKNPFELKFNGMNLFHIACSKGNKKIIKHYMSLNSNNIYIKNNYGLSGAFILAHSLNYNLLIQLIDIYPRFLLIPLFLKQLLR